VSFLSFNPLHCGAVVASGLPPRGRGCWPRVSIPFIAGQWSLHFLNARSPQGGGQFQSPSLRGSGRFVLTSSGCLYPLADVSIPFIAGQWSLPPARRRAAADGRRFQSPSLRGSGRFSPPGPRCGGRIEVRFNPLHCGAVVASGAPTQCSGYDANVSIPFIAGQWSLHLPLQPAHPAVFGVSIPFIAGQWSLHCVGLQCC